MKLERLREVRERLGVGQVELSKRAGVSRTTISRLENGHQEVYSVTLNKLARALGVHVTELTGGADDTVAYYERLFSDFEEESRRSAMGHLSEAGVNDLRQRIAANTAAASVALKYRPREAARFLRRGAELLMREAEQEELREQRELQEELISA